MTCLETYLHIHMYVYMGGCQNCGPFLGALNIRCPIIIGIHIYIYMAASSPKPTF